MLSDWFSAALQTSRKCGRYAQYDKTITFTFVALMLIGCVEQKDIGNFANDGVVIGKPLKVKEGGYLLPIEFTTKIMHSAQWLYDVKHEVVGNEVHITALYSVPPNAEKSIYKGHIKLSVATIGTYSVFYRNTNESKHYVGSINIE